MSGLDILFAQESIFDGLDTESDEKSRDACLLAKSADDIVLFGDLLGSHETLPTVNIEQIKAPSTPQKRLPEQTATPQKRKRPAESVPSVRPLNTPIFTAFKNHGSVATGGIDVIINRTPCGSMFNSDDSIYEKRRTAEESKRSEIGRVNVINKRDARIIYNKRETPEPIEKSATALFLDVIDEPFTKKKSKGKMRRCNGKKACEQAGVIETCSCESIYLCHMCAVEDFVIRKLFSSCCAVCRMQRTMYTIEEKRNVCGLKSTHIRAAAAERATEILEANISQMSPMHRGTISRRINQIRCRIDAVKSK